MVEFVVSSMHGMKKISVSLNINKRIGDIETGLHDADSFEMQ